MQLAENAVRTRRRGRADRARLDASSTARLASGCATTARASRSDEQQRDLRALPPRRGGRAAPRARGSASRSSRRSPRRTTAGSSSRARPGAGATLHDRGPVDAARRRARRRRRDADPDRRGRGADRLLPREGPACERLRDRGRGRRATRRCGSPAPASSTCSSSTSACPGKDGFEVLRELRGEADTLPVVILTARDGVDDTVAGLEGGADDYITKPFRFDELLARVRVRLRDERAGGADRAPGGRRVARPPHPPGARRRHAAST